MDVMFNNKKTTWIIISILVSIVIIGAISFTLFLDLKKVPNLQKMEYRIDKQPLIDRFGEKVGIESCFWKSGIIGNRGIGPSSYWMEGFVKISQESFAELKTDYFLTKIELNFEKGMSPDVTGFDNFLWTYNRELSHEIVGMGFIGEFYLDINNGILYFDLESQ